MNEATKPTPDATMTNAAEPQQAKEQGPAEQLCRHAERACTTLADRLACCRQAYGSNPYVRYTMSHRISLSKNREDGDTTDAFHCEKQMGLSLCTLGILTASAIAIVWLLGKLK